MNWQRNYTEKNRQKLQIAKLIIEYLNSDRIILITLKLLVVLTHSQFMAKASTTSCSQSTLTGTPTSPRSIQA